MPRRPLGRTGEHLSLIGLGGVTVMSETPRHAAEIVAEVFDAGVNYFDVAPTYGNAEERLGPALEPYRKQVFLACKTAERDAVGARRELENSLRLLRTDYLDLYQLHALTSREDVEQVFGPGGAIEVFREAREQGKVRFLGFSSHSVEASLAAMEQFDFDTILFPINCNLWYKENFGPQVVAAARQRGMGILALKACARRARLEGEERKYGKCWYIPLAEERELARGLYWTLSQPVTAAVPPGEEKFFRMALKLAPVFVPLADEEKEQLALEAEKIEKSLFTYPAWGG
ncbi:MAG: aldo/keto reductase [Candidatus Glassbacteria bacterium]|nr:aldo/keto reductase [Candidatus Glassbacteria bacterium]